MNEIDCLPFFLAIYTGEKYNECGVKKDHSGGCSPAFFVKGERRLTCKIYLGGIDL